jgi:hypothetical protein
MSAEYAHWSKDIIFVISDGHLDGMHAWLSAYHRPSNTGTSSNPLMIPSSTEMQTGTLNLYLSHPAWYGLLSTSTIPVILSPIWVFLEVRLTALLETGC